MTDVKGLLERAANRGLGYQRHMDLIDDLATALEQMQRDLEQRDDLLVKAEMFRFGPDLTVESRGPSRWVVCRSGAVLNTDGEFEYEPLPSSRSDEFIARTRTSFAQAVTDARALSPKEQS